MTGNRPPPIPPEELYRRPSAVGIPVAPHAFTPDTHVGAPAHAAWKVIVAVVAATAFVVTTYWRIDTRLSAREARDQARDLQIVDLSQKLDKVAGSERAIEARIIKQFRSGELYADCPAQTVRGVSTKPCIIRRLAIVDEE